MSDNEIWFRGLALGLILGALALAVILKATGAIS